MIIISVLKSSTNCADVCNMYLGSGFWPEKSLLWAATDNPRRDITSARTARHLTGSHQGDRRRGRGAFALRAYLYIICIITRTSFNDNEREIEQEIKCYLERDIQIRTYIRERISCRWGTHDDRRAVMRKRKSNCAVLYKMFIHVTCVLMQNWLRKRRHFIRIEWA